VAKLDKLKSLRVTETMNEQEEEDEEEEAEDVSVKLI